VIFDVIVFPLAAFVLFRDLSHKNAWSNYTILLKSHPLKITGWIRPCQRVYDEKDCCEVSW